MFLVFSFDVLGVVGGLLVLSGLAVDADRRVPVLLAGLAAAAACVSGDVALLAPAWIAAGVLTRVGGRAGGAVGPDDLRGALAVLGDGVAAAALVLVVVDGRADALPWEQGGPVLPDWAPALVALGVALRAAGAGLREPALLVVASVVATRMVVGGGWELDPGVVVTLAGLAGVLAWVDGPVAPIVLLALALGGVGDAGGSDAAVLIAAGAGLAAGAAGVARRPVPGLALLAVAPGVVALVRVPLAEAPEAAAVLAASLAIVGAAAVAAGSPRDRVNPPSGAAALAATAAAGALLTLAVLTPGAVLDALDAPAPPEGSTVVLAAERGRSALGGAAVFAAAVAVPAATAARRPPGQEPAPGI